MTRSCFGYYATQSKQPALTRANLQLKLHGVTKVCILLPIRQAALAPDTSLRRKI